MNFDLMMSTILSWRGFLGPGVIIIENIHQSTEYMHQISEVTLAFYKAFHDIHTLRHVVVDNVVNEDNLDFLYGQLHATPTVLKIGGGLGSTALRSMRPC